MNFACDSCQRRYTLPDEKVRGKIVKVRCKSCQNLITVGPLQESSGAPSGLSPWEDEPTRAAPALDRTTTWFAMVRGQQTGPFDVGVLEQQIRGGELTLRTYLWRPGMPDWLRAQDIAELAPLFSSAKSSPPAPAPVAPPPPADMTPAPTRSASAKSASGARSTSSRTPAPVRNQGVTPSVATEEVTRAVTSAELFAQAEAAAAEADVTAIAQTVGVRETKSTKLSFTPEPEPEPQPKAKANPAALGGELFSDLDLGGGEPEHEADAVPSPSEGKKNKKKKEKELAAEAQADDPFSQVADLDPEQIPVQNESTSFFIAQAGMNRRNPPWKIAAAVVGPIALVAALIYALNATHVAPQVTARDEAGNEVTTSVFSAQGLSGLGRTLLGQNKKPPPTTTVASNTRRRTSNPSGQGQGQGGAGAEHLSEHSASAVRVTDSSGKQKSIAMPVSADLKSLYEDKGGKHDVGPSALKTANIAHDSDKAGGPPEEAVAKIVGQTQPAFQSCIEQQLRKNPNFHGGKISITATVGASGTVKKAVINRPDIDTSDLGVCIKGRAKRMAFPAFAGDDVDLEIPLILTSTM